MNMSLPYDKTNKHSIIDYAKQLIGRSLNELCNEEQINKYSKEYISKVEESSVEYKPTKKNKGKFGNLLEEGYFGYEPNSRQEADFAEVGLELKSTPIKKLTRNDTFVAKERLVLSIIDYNKIINQTFLTSSLFMKSSSMLLVCYLYEKDRHFTDYIIHLVDEWEFTEVDLKIIEHDWMIIKNKVMQGKAHEISESDTYYLAACTKGNNAESMRSQPYSEERAKQRAYSLKQSYMNYVIRTISGGNENYGRLLKTPEIASTQTIEQYTISQFKPYIGLSESEIIKQLGISISHSKDYHARLSKAIMNINPIYEVEEFVKADIEIKTIRITDNNTIKEHISFPAFKYEDVLEETWETSLFYKQISKKFLFIFFKENINGDYSLDKVTFWSMPEEDIFHVEKIWNQLFLVISKGSIVREVKNGRRYTNFIGSKENPVSHIRPHAITSDDTYPLPIQDIHTGAMEYTKHCLWLNKSYVLDKIYLA